MLYGNRDKFDKVSKKIGRVFSKIAVTPSQWTVLSLIPSFFGFYYIAIEMDLLIAAVFLVFAAFFDLVDGAVARYKNTVSKNGAYLDTITDRYVEFLFIFGLFFVSLPRIYFSSEIWLSLILFGSLATTYSKSAAKEKEVTGEEIRGGLLERAERVMLLLLSLTLGSFNLTWMVYVLIVIAVLSNISALQRIYSALNS